MSRRVQPLLLVAAYAILCAAWVMTTPPFSAPDEWAHFLRALGISSGEPVGAPVSDYQDGRLSPAASGWVRQAIRTIRVPPRLAPDGYACNAFHPEQSAACADSVVPSAEVVERVTTVGTYQPVMYALPGVLARLGSEAPSANRWGRAAAALMSLGLLAAACLALVSGRSSAALAGLMLAVTPAALFTMSTLNTSGVEISAGVALMAAVLVLARTGPTPGWAWPLAGSSGAVLALSRSIGPAYVAFYAVLLLALSPEGHLRSLAKRHRRQVLLTGLVVAAAIAGNRLWEALYGPSITLGMSDPALALGEALRLLPK
ncbi:MAG: DUF2142 domain-containing protein, partial [Myxococcaceae bacterium]